MKVKRVERARPGFWTAIYLPSVVAGLAVTLRHMFRRKDTMQYPEVTREFGERYRGVPSLVKDEDGREKCVACYMCQFVCPSLAIDIEAGEYPHDHPLHAIEKYPARFDINMLRCIYCGLCEEVCPEEAIFMSKTYAVTGYSRELMIFDKDKLHQIGGTRTGDVKKWSEARKGPGGRSHVQADAIAAQGRAVLLALLFAAVPAWAVPGSVIDGKEPLSGVDVCHVVNGAKMLCVTSDSRGSFDLPQSNVGEIRFTKEGYLPLFIDELPDGKPVVMEPAAEIWVRLVDADDKPIDAGEVFLLYPTGLRKGPFPVNAKGVRVRTLIAGEYGVIARVEGYVQSRSHTATLVGGRVADAVVRLEIDPGPGDD